MKVLMFLLLMCLAPAVAWSAFTCADGTEMACLEEGDTVCPSYAKCVDKAAVCLDESACDSARGYICGSEYDAVLSGHQETVEQYNQLLSENVSLRNERLEKRNCVINSATLKDAIKCVRMKYQYSR